MMEQHCSFLVYNNAGGRVSAVFFAAPSGGSANAWVITEKGYDYHGGEVA